MKKKNYYICKFQTSTMKGITTTVLGSLTIALVAAIYGGNIVRQGTETYMVSLRFTVDGDTICGGTLITPYHVLTSAVCIGQKPLFVVVGTHHFTDMIDGEHIAIASYHSHPKFEYPRLEHNLAIVRLTRPSKFSPIQLPKLRDSDRTVGAGMLTISMGWGTTDQQNRFGHSDVLRSVELELWKTKDCKNATSLSFIDYRFLCAGGEEGKGVAFGDQGGPLIIKDNKSGVGRVLIGVLSQPVGTGEKHIPSVYTRISTELMWILFVLVEEMRDHRLAQSKSRGSN
ncbi:putative serine protease, trypsin domain, peptidase S1A, chymotrypsin family, peptidase S1, PA clan [Plasmopara halstedii]